MTLQNFAKDRQLLFKNNEVKIDINQLTARIKNKKGSCTNEKQIKCNEKEKSIMQVMN